MTEKTAEFRITVEGPPLSVEQLQHQLVKLSQEAERSGVSMDVKRIKTTETDLNTEFNDG